MASVDTPLNDHADRSAWLLPAFAAGAALLPLYPVLPPAAWLLVPAIPALAWQPARIAGCFLLGMAWTVWHAQAALDDRWPIARDGETVSIAGEVTGLVRRDGYRLRFDFQPEDSDLPEIIRVTAWRPPLVPRAGERWSLTLELHPPRSRVNPGAFDFERWLLARGIGATADWVAGERLSAADPPDADGFRLAVSERLQAEVPDLRAGGLMRALSVADRSGLDSDTRELLAHTGTAHLLAISGLHVAMVAGAGAFAAGLLGALAGLFRPAIDRRRAALLGGLVVALGYALLAGFTLPTRRAVIMLAVFAGALVMRRSLPPGRALAAALVAVILLDPLAPLDGGFWLSFCAVGVLVWVFGWRPPPGGRVRALVVAQFAIVFGMLPLVAGWFQQVTPVAVVANLVAIPLTGLLVLPPLLAGVVVQAAGLEAGMLLAVPAAGLDVLLSVLAWLRDWPGARLVVAAAGTPALIAAFLGGLWLLAPRGVPARGLGILLMLPLLLPAHDRPAPGTAGLWALDTGRGQAVLIVTAGSAWLYDTGPGRAGEWDRVDSVLAPAIRDHAGGGLDGIIVSRDSGRHAGGLASLRARYRPGTILAARPGPDMRACTAGRRWTADGVVFRFLHPPDGLPYRDRDSVCVLRIESGDGAVLITGAASEAVLERLADSGPAPAAVIVSHAGSRGPALDRLVRAVSAERVVVTGQGSAAGPAAVSVADCGAVRVAGDVIEGQRAAAPRFWRRVAGDRCTR